MGKKKNEVNGVLVYRRWSVGAILSALFLLAVIAAPVLAIVFNWLNISVPDAAVSAKATYRVAGLDVLRPIINKPFELQTLINDIASKTSVRFFGYIMKFSFYGVLGFLGIMAIFAVVEVFFFLFYLFTGRVVSPAAPVKVSWVLFVLTLIYAGISIGLAALMAMAYASAAKISFNFLGFLLQGLIGRGGSGLLISFRWPIIYVGISLVGAIAMSIVYTAAFKDKFFIGRAKRFGSGETVERYETNHFFNNGTPVTAGQPQVIVVNGSAVPATTAGGTVITTAPVAPGQEVSAKPQSDEVATPAVVLPSDIKSIGGHAFAKNIDLKYADIPDGIKELGVGAFANCLRLEIVSLPKSIKRIKKNCFFNCAKLARINYAGTKAEWRYVVRGSNWLDKAGTKTVVCSDGAIIVDPHR